MELTTAEKAAVRDLNIWIAWAWIHGVTLCQPITEGTRVNLRDPRRSFYVVSTSSPSIPRHYGIRFVDISEEM